MYSNKIFLALITVFISFNLYSMDKNIDDFFKKVQERKIEKLKTKLVNVDAANQKKIISIISKYDKEIFEIRKAAKRKRDMEGLGCENKLSHYENQLNRRVKVVSLELKKLSELKALKLDCKVLEEIITFEKRFVKRLRKIIREKHRKHGEHRRNGKNRRHMNQD